MTCVIGHKENCVILCIYLFAYGHLYFIVISFDAGLAQATPHFKSALATWQMGNANHVNAFGY